MSSYEVIPNCTVADGAGIGKCNASAYWGETWWRMMWPRRTCDSMVEAVALRSPRNLLQHRDIRRHQKVVCVETGEIVGYARWELPPSHSGEWLEAQVPDVDKNTREAIDARFAQADFNPQDDMMGLDDHVPGWRKKYIGDASVLQLDYLAVRPDHQRKGIGSMLVQSGLETADKLGLDVFILAMGRQALGLYLKSGCELLDQDSKDLRPCGQDDVYDTFFLVRRARKAQ